MQTLLLVLLPLAGLAAVDDSDLAAGIYQRSQVQGGLVVELGFKDVAFTTSLGAREATTLQTLCVDGQQVWQARTELRSRGNYGKLSVDQFDGQRLPYADDLVNLLVVHRSFATSDQCKLSRDELLRVLVPGGVLCTLGASPGNSLELVRKPWPDEIDQWTHFLHSASGNAVAQDQRVAPARALQWVGDPKYCRSHEIDSSLPAMVSAGGRLFYFLDEGPIGITDPRFPARWTLVARDAFNGVPLWKLPLKSWGWPEWKPEIRQADWRTLRGQRGKFPAEVPRRLVAAGDRVYVTLGFHDAPISIMDAATGAVLAVCEGTVGARELILDNGTLFAKVQPANAEAEARRGRDTPARLVAVSAETGKLRWAQEVGNINTLSLAAGNGSVVFLRGGQLRCHDQQDGTLQWESDCPRSTIVVIYNEVVLVSGKIGVHAYSLAEGNQLWQGPNMGRDLLVIDDLVWRVEEYSGILDQREEHWPTLSRRAGARLTGYDYRTGGVQRAVEVPNAMSPGHHLRCYRSKATSEYIIYPKRGAEFLDLDGSDHMRHDWLRGSCRFGIVPCNGLLYTPPDQCFCYIGAKMEGLVATSSAAAPSMPDPRGAERLMKGPAFGKVAAVPEDPADWPALRHDARRSGANRKASVTAELTQRWTLELDGKLTQPTVAAGKVFVASVDQHTVSAVDAQSGQLLWEFVAGGRVDSSPTYYDGLLLFGSNDGRVYGLDAESGELSWQFQAAPSSRRITAFGQVESSWPVHGSVLVMNSLAYFVAGRSTLIDGGAHFYALEPKTGKVVHYRHVEQPRPDLDMEIGEHFAMDGSNVDVLTTDGEHLFCMQEMLDAELKPVTTEWNTRYGDRYLGKDHLMATGGLLDDTGFNRVFWTYGNRWPGFYFMLMAPKSGNLLVFDDQHTWATKWFVERNIHSALFFPETTGYLLFCDHNSTQPFLVGDRDAPQPIQWLPDTLMKPYKYDGHAITNRYDNYTVEVDKGAGFTRPTPAVWQRYVPVRIEAMALTRDALFAAGTPDVLKTDDPLAALEGRLGGVLLAVDPESGEQLWRVKLTSAPRFDGISAAGRRLFLVGRTGTLSAWE